MIRLRRIPWLDIVAVLALVAVVCKYTQNIEQTMDVRSADETCYLHGAYTLLKSGWTSPAYGPLYQAWYFVWSHLQSDPLALYYLNYRVLTFAIPLGLYFLLRRLNVHPLVGFLAAVFIVSSFTPYIWPYPAHLATACLLIGAGIALGIRERTLQFAVIVLGTQLAAYVRPELYVSFLLLTAGFLGLLAWTLFKDRQRLLCTWPFLAAGLLVSLVLVGVLGCPLMERSRDNRSFIAFGQHYAVNRVASTKENICPWTNWEAILARDFGSARSLGACLSSNRAAFVRHVRQNGQLLLLNLESLSRFNTGFAYKRIWRPLLLGFILLMLLGRLARIRVSGDLGLRQLVVEIWARAKRPAPENAPPSIWPVVVLLVALLAAALPSALLVQPRLHYLLPAWSVAFSLFVWFLFRSRARLHNDQVFSSPVRSLALMALVAVTIFFLPRREEGLYDQFVWEKDMTMTKTVEFMRKLRIDSPARMLRADIGLEWYIGDNFLGLAPWERPMPFAKLIEQASINIIVDDPALRDDTRLREDRQFQALLERPDAYGFTALPITGTSRRLLIKPELLSRSTQERTSASVSP